MYKRHSDSKCAKTRETKLCKCQTCWGLMHGVQELNLDRQIEEIKRLLPPVCSDSDNDKVSIELKKKCITYHRQVVLDRYPNGTNDTNNLDDKLWSLAKKINVLRSDLKNEIQKECETFRKDPENYIKDNCLDIASKQITQQVIDTLIPETNKGQGIKECVNMIAKCDHLFCVICVAILKLIKKGQKYSSKIASAIAEGLVELIKLFGDLPETTERIIKVVLKTMLAKAFSRIVKATILSMLPGSLQNETAVQMLGFITCPNTEKHSDVVKYCAKPLLGEILKDDIRDQLNKFYDQAMKGGGSCPVIEASFS